MNCEQLIQENHILGFITERDFDQAEEAFPGIVTFYEHCGRKPSTFLDLVWQFEKALADRNDVPNANLLTRPKPSADGAGPVREKTAVLALQ
jgi:hypothetical protein